MSQTSSDGWFGSYGGRFVAETLVPALEELTEAYAQARRDPGFCARLDELLRDYVGRPTPLGRAARWSEAAGADIWLKREDLSHTGAHKVNNTLGQVLLAKRMGKTRVIAETGAGQHGVATATTCALLGLPCEIYMGAEDVRRQAPNVARMKLLGAEVHPVMSGSRTLKDAMNEALRDWVTHVATTYYCVGSVAGPHPYPSMVADFQEVIGREARAQMLAQAGRLPTHVVACVGGGSNAMGIFRAFLPDAEVGLVGVEAAGSGVESGAHAATLTAGRVGVLHGSKSYVLQTEDGQIKEAHSISAGLDYPGVGPEHAHLKDTGRVHYVAIDDAAALRGFSTLARLEGILPALETSHAVAHVTDLCKTAPPASKPVVLVSISGRGDKDLDTVRAALEGGELGKAH